MKREHWKGTENLQDGEQFSHHEVQWERLIRATTRRMRQLNSFKKKCVDVNKSLVIDKYTCHIFKKKGTLVVQLLLPLPSNLELYIISKYKVQKMNTEVAQRSTQRG